jgi:aconitate hydratase 2/2-methylisocitrate dehydratase
MKRKCCSNGDVVLEEAYSVATGTVLDQYKTKKLYNGDKS